MKEKNSQSELTKNSLFEELSNALDFQFQETKHKTTILKWVEKINLPSGLFTFQNHEYQEAILQEDAIRQVLKKGTQLGISETQILKSIHGLLYGRYPQGVLYLFPTQKMSMIFPVLDLGLFLWTIQR